MRFLTPSARGLLSGVALSGLLGSGALAAAKIAGLVSVSWAWVCAPLWAAAALCAAAIGLVMAIIVFLGRLGD